MTTRILSLAALIGAAPLAAQTSTPATRADTAAILRAATDTGWRLVATRDLRIVGDTATLVVEQQKEMPFGTIPRVDSQPSQVVSSTRRVERRDGRWVRTSDRSHIATRGLIDSLGASGNRRLEPGVSPDTARLRADSGRIRP